MRCAGPGHADPVTETPSGPADDLNATADEARADALPDDSPLQPGLAAHTVDPATGEYHTGR
ncbi:MAG: hypothetical protein JWO60_974 [Frankiales bacterium]|nr:hypothetical protein [Frankiales bacterium]